MAKISELEQWQKLNQHLQSITEAASSKGIELRGQRLKTWSKIELELLASIFLRSQYQANIRHDIVLVNEALLRDFLSFIDSYEVVRK